MDDKRCVGAARERHKPQWHNLANSSPPNAKAAQDERERQRFFGSEFTSKRSYRYSEFEDDSEFEDTPSWREMAGFCAKRPSSLNAWESDFIANIRRRIKTPTESQLYHLEIIYNRLRKNGRRR